MNLNRIKIYSWVTDTMNKTVDKFTNKIVPFGPPKCLVYFSLPWIGSPCQLIADKVSSAVLHAVLMRLSFEPFLQLVLHFALFIRMCSLFFNKVI